MTEQNGVGRSSATDELRRMLDERGVEWKAPNDATRYIKTKWRVGPWEYEAVETSGGEFSIYVEHRYWLTPAQAIEATLGKGMLTADDVRDLIERHSDASGGNGRDFHNGAYVSIADELNATLGRGMCHITDNGPFDADVNNGEFNYCPNCEREVER